MDKIFTAVAELQAPFCSHRRRGQSGGRLGTATGAPRTLATATAMANVEGGFGGRLEPTPFKFRLCFSLISYYNLPKN